MPPENSLPITKPPWAWYTVLSWILMFSQGPAATPAAPAPPFMQIPSSPASITLFTMSTSLQLEISIASPFWAFHGHFTVIPSIVTFLHRVGMIWNLGLFRSVTPCTSTFSQLVNLIMCVRAFSCSSIFSATLGSCFRLKGYQMLPFSFSVPPIAWNSFHSTSLTLLRFTGLHHSPFPSIVPSPVMEIFFLLLALMAGVARLSFFPVVLSILKWSFLSSERTMMAFFSRCRSILSFSEMRPVR